MLWGLPRGGLLRVRLPDLSALWQVACEAFAAQCEAYFYSNLPYLSSGEHSQVAPW